MAWDLRQGSKQKREKLEGDEHSLMYFFPIWWKYLKNLKYLKSITYQWALDIDWEKISINFNVLRESTRKTAMCNFQTNGKQKKNIKSVMAEKSFNWPWITINISKKRCLELKKNRHHVFFNRQAGKDRKRLKTIRWGKISHASLNQKKTRVICNEQKATINTGVKTLYPEA